MKKMSNRQKQVYDFIADYYKDHGISPSIADIAKGLGLSNSTIATYIEALKLKGCVTNIPGVPRSFRAVEQGEKRNL